jgi:hypothetical protein
VKAYFNNVENTLTINNKIRLLGLTSNVKLQFKGIQKTELPPIAGFWFL